MKNLLGFLGILVLALLAFGLVFFSNQGLKCREAKLKIKNESNSEIKMVIVSGQTGRPEQRFFLNRGEIKEIDVTPYSIYHYEVWVWPSMSDATMSTIFVDFNTTLTIKESLEVHGSDDCKYWACSDTLAEISKKAGRIEEMIDLRRNLCAE